ncbi:HNH endonuclease [Mycobacterium ahvazicum]|uniref:HNH endonuclease n=1 Tax=Mycobacterium ahvazicum TaxID=1964395 RepID=A0A2K4YFG6_9MYCO|nr:HNH endonuclease signature motif containing protein [Mycobacterium ahvazicum]SOX55532.1 HNH endonuclease [Mycobacterium ahvazicum]
MFDSDRAVVASITECARAEAAAAARKLQAVAELVRLRADGPVDRGSWSCDNWDAIAAEVAAAQGISHGTASGQMYLAVALRDRLPRVAALFAEGVLSARLATALVWRTDLITDPRTLQIVDAALAGAAARFGPLSAAKSSQAIDTIVDRHDPAAVRRTRAAARGRDVVISPADGNSGTAALWGSLFATDAAVLDRRLTQMAHQVCDRDPRTLAQRRADALGALAAGSDLLACACGAPECPAALDTDPRARAVMIHVIAEEAALGARPDPCISGELPSRPLTADTPLHVALAPDPEPPAPEWTPAAHIRGGGMVPAPLMAELIRNGAKVRPVVHPAGACPEAGYHPSAGLDRFIRCRDLTCRFPGCDRPAEYCDLDHTVPYPLGPTHASNLKCLCRKHHLLKTFWTSWHDEQRPDGTVVWTTPNGQTYVTRPGSSLLFPALCLPTGELPTAPRSDHPPGGRGVLMPRRHRTREQDRAYRIKAERSLNVALG